MKKLLFMMAASSMLLASCNNEPSYTITGTTPQNLPDGSYAYLKKSDFRTVIDSAMVKNHTFTFKGREDSIQSCFVTYRPEKKLYYASFYLENANLKAELNEKIGLVTGSPINDAASKFAKANNDILLEMKATRKQMFEPEITEEARQQLEEKMKGLQEQQKGLVKQTINENINNFYGAALVGNAGAYLTLDEQKALIEKVPEQWKNDRLKEVEEHISVMQKTAVGQKFTDLTMNDPTGKEVKLSEFVAKNKVTMVDFWASWCGPCRKEMKNFKKAYDTYHKKGLGVVGISLDKDADKWKKAIEEEGIEWENMSDLKGWECEGAKMYGIGGIPATLLIANDGTIIARNLRGEKLLETLEELLK